MVSQAIAYEKVTVICGILKFDILNFLPHSFRREVDCDRRVVYTCAQDDGVSPVEPPVSGEGIIRHHGTYLRTLSIKNLALVADSTLQLEPGLVMITGERWVCIYDDLQGLQLSSRACPVIKSVFRATIIF